MSLEITNSSKFEVIELTVVTKGGKVDISRIYEEINLFDSLFVPVMSGIVVINDAIGLSNKLLFDGSESLLINITKTASSSVLNFKKAFRIFKQSFRQYPSIYRQLWL